MEDESNEAEKKMLQELNSSVDVVKRQCVGADAGLLAGRVEELQSELLTCQKQNMRLKFELEEAVVTQPRMKVCTLTAVHICACYLQQVQIS